MEQSWEQAATQPHTTRDKSTLSHECELVKESENSELRNSGWLWNVNDCKARLMPCFWWMYHTLLWKFTWFEARRTKIINIYKHFLIQNERNGWLTCRKNSLTNWHWPLSSSSRSPPLLIFLLPLSMIILTPWKDFLPSLTTNYQY